MPPRAAKRRKTRHQSETEDEQSSSEADSLSSIASDENIQPQAPVTQVEDDDEDEDDAEDDNEDGQEEEEEGSDVVQVAEAGTPGAGGGTQPSNPVLNVRQADVTSRDSARNTRAKAAANGKESNAQATANGQQNEAPNSLAKRNAQNENAAQIPTARTTPFPTGTWAFVNKDDLQRRVTKIASEGSMRALKSDTLDVLSVAVQHRLRGLLSDILVARNHRISANHQRPPPIWPKQFPKEFASIFGDLEDEIMDDDDDPLQPMWDQTVYDDTSKVLSAIAHVERLAERQARRNRNARDIQEEAEEQQAREQAAMDAENATGDSQGGGNADGDNSNKNKRKAKPSAMREARNIDAATQNKLSKATASSALGLPRFNWMQGGAAALSSSGRSTPTSGTSRRKGGSASAKNSADQAADDDSLAAVKGTIGATASENLEAEPTLLWRDAIFALERERGTGAGAGSGARTMYKSYALRKNPLL